MVPRWRPHQPTSRRSKASPTTDHTFEWVLGKIPVTQALWGRVMGNRSLPFKDSTPTLPVTMILWDEIELFLELLNELHGTSRDNGLNTKGTFRLPTKEEWEYACRAGVATKYSFGDDSGELGKFAWFKGNSDNKRHPAGQKEPNSWGLFDMHGNVWEYCDSKSNIVFLLKGGSYVDLEPSDKLLWRGEQYEPRKDRDRIGRCANIGFRCLYVEIEGDLGDSNSLVPNLTLFVQEQWAHESDPSLRLPREDYKRIFEAMAALPIQSVTNLPPEMTKEDGVSVTKAVQQMVFFFAQAMCQGRKLEIEMLTATMLRLKAGMSFCIVRTGSNEFRISADG